MPKRKVDPRRKRRSNRRNSLLSTGPRTPEGKAAVRGNAIKHGLSVALANSPEYQAALARWTDALSGDSLDLVRIGYAQTAAAAQMETARIRHRRAELMDMAAADKTGLAAEASMLQGPSFAERLKQGGLQELAELENRLPVPKDPNLEAMAFLWASAMLKSIERYEEREFARRNRALRLLTGEKLR